jgi:hypothetical protein
MDLRLATLKAVSFYLLHNVSTFNQCMKLPCGTVLSKHFDSYQGYPNYIWDLMPYFFGHFMAEGVCRWVSPGMLGFEPRPIDVEFMVDKV